MQYWYGTLHLINTDPVRKGHHLLYGVLYEDSGFPLRKPLTKQGKTGNDGRVVIDMEEPSGLNSASPLHPQGAGQVRAADRVVKNRFNVQQRDQPMKYDSVLGANGRV